MDENALVHLRVPMALKTRWVCESRSAGMKLTEWIVHRIEHPRHVVINVPVDLDFADLKLRRDSDGAVSLDWAPVHSICKASGLPVDYFQCRQEDALAAVLTQWYRSHLAAGGAPDPVQEDLIAETQSENEHGGGISHAPGRA